MQTLIRRRVLRRLIWVCIVYQCPSSGFTVYPLYSAQWHHSDKNSAAINNCYLDFVQPRGWISLVDDNHVDKYVKEILTFVHYGSIVNSRLKRLRSGKPEMLDEWQTVWSLIRRHVRWRLIRIDTVYSGLSVWILRVNTYPLCVLWYCSDSIVHFVDGCYLFVLYVEMPWK